MGGGGGFDLLALPAFLPSGIFSFFLFFSSTGSTAAFIH